MARISSRSGRLARLPLILLLTGVASLAMYAPAAYALAQDQHAPARSFFYAGTLGLIATTLIALSLGGRGARTGAAGQLASLLAAFAALPLFLAVPFHDSLPTTSFLNAYFTMVSAVTTTGADLYTDPARLPEVLHLWRALVAWLGGFLMWVAASAVLAPLSLGGFEVTARGAPGTSADPGPGPDMIRPDPNRRLQVIARTLAPVYGGLTLAAWLLLLMAGERPLVAACHAMSVLSTSGISPVGGVQGGQAGLAGEAVLFLFMFFALSRLTFSSDTVTTGTARLDRDPEFRIGLLIVMGVPLLLFLRHWVGAYEVAAGEDAAQAFRALWGSVFTVLSFLSTTGFESDWWEESQRWSGLGTPGLVLMGLALIGGGVATTAGGVKLLRVFALYLNGLREMEKLVHPSSVSGEGNRRIHRDGAFIAWIFFMLFALSLTTVTVLLAALGTPFHEAVLLAVATLSTTGPLIETAAEAPIALIELGAVAKAVLCAAMILGRLETLAIIALFSPDLWRT